LEAFINSLAANCLASNLEKCIFAVPKLEILGHTISAAGSATTAGLKDIKQLQCFLGMMNFYRHFLSNWSQVLCPLTDLLKGEPKTLEWTSAAL
jgi:hypothetical protein